MVQDLMYNILQRHNNHSSQTETLDWDLHDLWYTLICAASICDADGAEQDTLACYAIHARELNFTRAHEGTETPIPESPIPRLRSGRLLDAHLKHAIPTTSPKPLSVYGKTSRSGR